MVGGAAPRLGTAPDDLLAGYRGDPRYARALAVLPTIVAHLSLSDVTRSETGLRLHVQRAAELSAWIERGEVLPP